MKKRAVISVISVLLVLVCAVTAGAAAIKIDGKNNNNEWAGCDSVSVDLFSKTDAGNNMNGAAALYTFKDDYTLLLLIIADIPSSGNNKEIEADKNNISVVFSVDDCEEVVLSLEEFDGSGSKILSDDDNYQIEGALTYDNSGSLICEISATDKNSFGKSPELKIAFTDCYGSKSKTKDISLNNPVYTTTTTKENTSTVTTKKSSGSVKSGTTSNNKDESTTRDIEIKTSAQTSYKSRVRTTTTEKSTTEKTTKVKTTKEKTTKTKKTRTTKPKTTKAQTTKTTKQSEEYYTYDNDIIVENPSASAASDDSLFDSSSLSDSSKYKIAVGAGAALLFVIIAVSAMRTKTQADKEEKEENGKDEKDKEDNGD